MTPVLYNKNEINYTKAGMQLSEAVECQATEERNGAYDLIFSYPVAGVYYDHIQTGTLIKAKSNDTSNEQLFRVQKIIKILGGIATYYATHISYELYGYPLYPGVFTNLNPGEAINLALSRLTYSGSELYSVWSDITTRKTFAHIEPRTMRNFLGGAEGSILDVWGYGEYEFDNRNIKYHASRGQDNGVAIAYGKNLIDFKQEENIENTYTHLTPYAYHNDILYYIPGSAESITIPGAASIGHNKAYLMKFDFEDGETPSRALLKTKADAYIAANDLGKPKVSLNVKFIPLWQTTEYVDVAPIERVKLCDTVTVQFERLGISAKAKVIKTVYDSLKERYISIEIGDAKTDIVDAIKSIK